MIQSDKLKKIIAEVKEESSPVITLSNELIADFSKELDSAISELDMIMESIGENSIEDIPDSQIEYYCVKIPALMYYAGQRVEELGMQVDLASNASPNEGGGVDIAIIRNVIELNYNLGITDADVNLFNTEVGIMQELGGEQ